MIPVVMTGSAAFSAGRIFLKKNEKNPLTFNNSKCNDNCKVSEVFVCVPKCRKDFELCGIFYFQGFLRLNM